MIATVCFVLAVRPGEKYKDGSYKSSRQFFDVVVNGTSLWECLGKRHDMVSVLCCDFALPESLRALDRLWLKAEADFPDDRCSLFICAECGDLGCGAVTLSVRRAGGKVLWSDFGYENSYEDQVLREHYRDVGPFEFDSSDYEAALLDAMQQFKTKCRI
jgi:hypothetical protein